MVKLTVNIQRNEDLSYPIYIGSGVLGKIKDEVIKCSSSSVVVITDSIVSRLYLSLMISYLKVLNLPIHVIIIPTGEKYKNRKTKEYIENEMLRFKVDRKGIVVAFGGGVVGDIAGFVSSTYLRGINFIQVPTTLLSMVDSSIGGKVGVDTPYGKNTVGAFHQPKSVIIDTMFLDTLPEIQYKNGLVEVIKHAIIRDEDFFKFLEDNHDSIVNKDDEIVAKMIEISCRIKKEVVEADEREVTGLRQILNFGHTVGHAIELFSNYRILHGLAVGVGIVVESFISTKINVMKKSDYDRIVDIMKLYKIPTTLRDLGVKNDSRAISNMIEFMKGDKKSLKSQINMSLPKSIGRMVDTYAITIEPRIIIDALKVI
ncbi:MAG: 3-dehydroquinate synthase [Brevinematales bacterium]|nr:3-dehydroquinate synthase [Brevinematales bacterium]